MKAYVILVGKHRIIQGGVNTIVQESSYGQV